MWPVRSHPFPTSPGAKEALRIFSLLILHHLSDCSLHFKQTCLWGMSRAVCEKWIHYIMKNDQQLQYANTANNKTSWVHDKSCVCYYRLSYHPSQNVQFEKLKCRNSQLKITFVFSAIEYGLTKAIYSSTFTQTPLFKNWYFVWFGEITQCRNRWWRHHLPCYKTLYHHHGFDDLILRSKSWIVLVLKPVLRCLYLEYFHALLLYTAGSSNMKKGQAGANWTAC